MVKKKNIWKIALVFFTLLLVLTNISVVFATWTDGDDKTYTPKEFTKNPDGSEGGEIETRGTGVTNVKSVGGKIVGIIQVVGTIISVAMIIVLGIKYMMGSAEEKAAYKSTLLPYFIGAVLIFAASNLSQIIYSWTSKI